VGHSLGGLLSLLAACRRPDLAASLVMLDSPVVTGWRAGFLRVSKSTGLIHHVSPGKASMRRRQHWPDREAVYQHFKSKAVFAAWDDRVLRDYVATGFVERNGHVELAFDREVETLIYNTLPHHLGALLKRHPPACPVSFVAGTDSQEMRQGGTAAALALAGQRYVHIPGTHLYPMERPEETARHVLALLAQTPSL
jgi:pimeloyl-ACP methyl ester carboxylesterase